LTGAKIDLKKTGSVKQLFKKTFKKINNNLPPGSMESQNQKARTKTE